MYLEQKQMIGMSKLFLPKEKSKRQKQSEFLEKRYSLDMVNNIYHLKASKIGVSK